MSWFAVTKSQKKIGSLAHVFHFLSRVKKEHSVHQSYHISRYNELHYYYDELDRWDRPRVDSYMSSMIQVIEDDIENTRLVISSRLKQGSVNYGLSALFPSERQYRMATEQPMVELFKEDKIPKELTGFDDITNMTDDDIIRTWKEFRTKYPEFCKIYLTTHPVPRYVQLIKRTTKRSRF